MKAFFLLYFLLNVDSIIASCAVRSFGKGKFVCVCNETFCDQLTVLYNISKGTAALYETNHAGKRFQAKTINFFDKIDPDIPVLLVDTSKMYQFILGFGGAFTDAAGINMNQMSSKLQKELMLSYFSETGTEYNMGRLPMASCDFSTHPYSYDDVPDDFDLKHFKLAKEDFLYKIPYVQQAAALMKEELLLFASPWSPPAWMKTNNAMNGKGTLRGEPSGKYYETWAKYFVRFLQEYEKNNITFWGITTQNEPTDGCIEDFPFQSMCFPPDKQRDFIKWHLGPALQGAGFGVDKLKVMIMDDLRMLLPKWAQTVMQDEEASKYVSGIAFHWYLEQFSPHKLLNITHNQLPSLFLLATEACTGSYFWEIQKVDLGNWERAERYAYDIIQDLLNWSIGWIDWNLALDMEGGPNWVKNYVDAPIIINAKATEFYKQPMYYALAQFSKLLPRGSFRVYLEIPESIDTMKNLKIAAFQRPDDKVVLIVVNRNDEAIRFALKDFSKGFLNVTAEAHGIQSYVW